MVVSALMVISPREMLCMPADSKIGTPEVVARHMAERCRCGAAIQALGAFRQLQIVWVEPMNTLLVYLSLPALALDPPERNQHSN